MQRLQGNAGDLQSRLSSISSGLRGLNLGTLSMGPIGLFAVPSLNASNDQAIAQADGMPTMRPSTVEPTAVITEFMNGLK